MATVTVERTIPAPVEAVFAALTDHAHYARFPGIRHSELVKPGSPAPNGLGAQRIVDAGLLWVREDITAWEDNRRFDYRIVESRPRIDHEHGSLVFEAVEGGTKVTWTSTLRFPWPLIGDLVARAAAPKIRQSFGAVLKSVERELAAEAA